MISWRNDGLIVFDHEHDFAIEQDAELGRPPCYRLLHHGCVIGERFLTLRGAMRFAEIMVKTPHPRWPRILTRVSALAALAILTAVVVVLCAVALSSK